MGWSTIACAIIVFMLAVLFVSRVNDHWHSFRAIYPRVGSSILSLAILSFGRQLCDQRDTASKSSVFSVSHANDYRHPFCAI